jgi:shikimate kinase
MSCRPVSVVQSKRHLVLIGMMGTGKSTVGARCAESLDRPFVDTDDVVVQLAGATIPELFEKGEHEFRRHEHAAVAIVAQSPEPLVIACGGGAVLDAENRNALRGSGFVVWLQAPVDVLVERIGAGSDRPLLADTTARAATLDRLITLREPAYSATADAAVDARGAPDEVADKVLAAFGAG